MCTDAAPVLATQHPHQAHNHAGGGRAGRARYSHMHITQPRSNSTWHPISGAGRAQGASRRLPVSHALTWYTCVELEVLLSRAERKHVHVVSPPGAFQPARLRTDARAVVSMNLEGRIRRGAAWGEGSGHCAEHDRRFGGSRHGDQ